MGYHLMLLRPAFSERESQFTLRLLGPVTGRRQDFPAPRAETGMSSGLRPPLQLSRRPVLVPQRGHQAASRAVMETCFDSIPTTAEIVATNSFSEITYHFLMRILLANAHIMNCI